jgi:putative Holliday junction resolvase
VGRVLAVDLGTRRVGLALTDPERRIASPLDTVAFRSFENLADDLEALGKREGVDLYLIGLPLRDGGREGEGCVRSRILSERLSSRGLSCELWDESWSSREAGEAMRLTGTGRRKARGKIDAVAASLFLRDYLDRRV